MKVRDKIAFLGIKEMDDKIVDENGLLRNQEIELHFMGIDGIRIIEKIEVLAKSKNYLITKDGVIRLSMLKPLGVEQDENLLTFEEFLANIDG